MSALDVDRLCELVRLPVDLAVLDETRNEPALQRVVAATAARAALQYAVENGLVSPADEADVPLLLPSRVGQPRYDP